MTTTATTGPPPARADVVRQRILELTGQGARTVNPASGFVR